MLLTTNEKRAACVPLVFILAVVYLAIRYYWLNDDALNYLMLADHVSRLEHLVTWSWTQVYYWAVFPIGYPAVVAAFKLLLMCDVLTASKIANGVLLMGSILIAARWMKLPVLLASSLFFTATMLEITSYSWSENLFIFSNILALSSRARFQADGNKKALLFYGVGLLLCASSRYIGGFLLAGYGLLLLLNFLRVPRSRSFAAAGVTVACGLCFAGYLYLNFTITGHATGMGRTPASEGLGELLFQFIAEFAASLWILVPPLVLLFACGARAERLSVRQYPAVWPALILGGFYLVLLFALRSHSHFENFSGRLLSPGLFLIYLAGLHMAWHGWKITQPLERGKMQLIALAFALVNLGIIYGLKFIETPPASDEHAAQTWQTYGTLPEGTVLITIGHPKPMGATQFLYPIIGQEFFRPVFVYDRVFYALYANFPIPLDEYKGLLGDLRYKGQKPTQYLFDFIEFGDIEEVNKVLHKQEAEPAFAQWVRSHFSPHAFVPCKECNQLNKKP